MTLFYSFENFSVWVKKAFILLQYHTLFSGKLHSTLMKK